jgi:hypothetical protein
MRLTTNDVAARFSSLPRQADDTDWEDVLLRAGLPSTARRRLGRLSVRSLVVISAVFVVGLAGATLFGTRLHRADAAPPGPTHVQRRVGNGTVRWLFAHEPRGQSLAQAHIPLLSTTGARWQPVRFARVITPDPNHPVKVVLSLIGKRGRNLCMTVYYGYSSSGGCAVGLLLKPFNYNISSHMNPNCSSCGGVVVAGVASDDVARMELFRPGGAHRAVSLKDNVFLLALPPNAYAWNLVAYDRNGLIIGRSVPPAAIHPLK